MRTSIFKYGRYVALTGVLAFSVLLSGCKQELYSDVSEQDANEMVAALLASGVDASKALSADGKSWSLEADSSDFARAMQILSQRGLPHRNFDNLGNLFKKDGLISTPSEERVRFIYGTQQELSNTLSQIDGVLVARVQIVLPNNDPLAQTIKPSSASVFIKYRPGADVRAWIPQIKTLVMHSVEGLTYDAVSVITMPADSIVESTYARQPTQQIWLRRALEIALLAGAIAILALAQRNLSVSLKLAVASKPSPTDATDNSAPAAAEQGGIKGKLRGAFSPLFNRLKKKRPAA